MTITWDNGQGLKFARSFALDDAYMFTVTQRVVNSGSTPVTLYPFGLVARHGTPQLLNYYILHEGLIGVLDGALEEVKYKAVRDKQQIRAGSKTPKFASKTPRAASESASAQYTNTAPD